MASLLESDTSELMFQFEEGIQLSSSIRLRNPTENQVAFKIQCTRPRRYGVLPWIGILSPGDSCEVTVRTLAPRRVPTNMQTWHSRDIFKIQSVLARPGTTREDAPNLFNTAAAHIIEHKLRVGYTTESSLATTSEDYESRPIVEESVKVWEIPVGALILKCFICSFVVVASYYLMKQTCSLIWALTKSMVMLLMKMLTKLVSESIEDWVAKTLICVFMSLVCKYKDWLRIMLRAQVWDQVMDLMSRKTELLQMLTARIKWNDVFSGNDVMLQRRR